MVKDNRDSDQDQDFSSAHMKRQPEQQQLQQHQFPSKKQRISHHDDSHQINHRPVTSCTHCRQHKIKCDASQNFPHPCSRCEKIGLHCEINPQFRPKKGSQLQLLRQDVDEIKSKLDTLLANDSVFVHLLQQIPMGNSLLNKLNLHPTPTPGTIIPNPDSSPSSGSPTSSAAQRDSKVSVQTYLSREPQLSQANQGSNTNKFKANNEASSHMTLRASSLAQDSKGLVATEPNKLPPLLNDSALPNNSKESLPPALQMAFYKNNSAGNTPNGPFSPIQKTYSPHTTSTTVTTTTNQPPFAATSHVATNNNANRTKTPVVATTTTMPLLPSPHANVDEFVLGDISISIEKANRLHHIFVTRYLPYFPIMYSNNATELYSQSQLLFWTVMLTACLSDPEPTMYCKLSSLIKQLAIETCWIRTPRSTHISQALLILCIWPLPNQKVLDDCSYRFVGLAKSLSYQLGLHRGEFISEFTRTQTSMPNAEKWRTRTWLGIFFAELCWASILGLPPTSQTDYLLEKALSCGDEESEEDNNDSIDNNNNDKRNKKDEPLVESKYKLPGSFRRLLSLANFQAKLSHIIGSSTSSPDGLLEPKYRAETLSILGKELDLLAKTLNFQSDDTVNIYFLYVKLTVCCFAFLPETPPTDQIPYVTEAYLTATKIVTLLNNLLETHQLIELPIYIRQAATFSALILFKLQLTPLLPDKYFDSARQSVVTIHRLYRNQLTAWATSVENDISRTASMLEKLNFVLIMHPEVFVEEDGIISRMRSHLTGSLFYDLVWCVHEARRREMDPEYNKQALEKAAKKRKFSSNGIYNGASSTGGITDRKLYPLPLYNHISRDDFETVTKTTPSGTTVTTLVPTKNALKQAEKLAKTNNGDSDGSIMEINGIPLSMLGETGSVKFQSLFANTSNSNDYNNNRTLLDASNDMSIPSNSIYPVASVPASNNNPQSTKVDYYSNGPSVIPDLSMKRSVSTPVNHFPASVPGLRNHPVGNLSNNVTLGIDHPIPREHSNIQNVTMNYNNQFSNANAIGRSQSSMSHSRTPIASKSNNMTDLHSVVSDPGSSKSTAYPPLSLFSKSNDINSNKTNQRFSTGTNTVTSSNFQTIDNENNVKTPGNKLTDFFQQQSAGWIEGNSSNDDFFGWFDMNMEQGF
ncbi:CPS_HP_G0055420.mRNA.1.CDS.1 [Saccharomyces cerevisiae]|nr:CPS_HP_G0016930.mRNA.1.CDS.1 [Saccharomyces cerevisiae]CAI4924064.1 CPS_HP_G0022050.mRNA.1.CDS.1 [Saccharomyces cerevisiae]CAI4974910.1 CPS_HP_G0055420.mRNA.1.CDS.1 [Saccharomyces cerevisiae]CAI6421636.1 CPS_HP_G0016930.mRNA.1.CDS.1 [Saccharomyces cerevisiae]CAI6450020.1 CPS_HP_G0022050.mRNA.1.CDS.1 [Saccharomyces cerevisiae]